VPDFLLPDLGEGLTEAEIVEWRVKIGDAVTIDQHVVDVETAKAVVEVPVPFAGLVTVLHGKVGDVVTVGLPLITVAEDQAPGPAVSVPSTPPTTSAVEGLDEPGVITAASTASDTSSGNVLIGYGTSRSARRRRRSNVQPALEKSASRPAAVQRAGRTPVVSPLVRRLAVNAGLDLGSVEGSGTSGLITRQDVERALRNQPDLGRQPGVDPVAGHLATGDVSGTPDIVRVPIRGLRKAVVDKLTKSRREIPEATVWVDVDATGLLELRSSLNADSLAPKISMLALISRFAVLGLLRFPELNSKIEAEEIVIGRTVNLGFAAQTDRGLMVPVVPSADALSLEQLSAALAERAVRARDGKLGPSELTGGTFTVNNYGVFGVDGSAAIINHPEVGILGIGRVFGRPWVVNDQIVPRRICQLTLAFDHRACDGGTAGGFLRFVADCVESPGYALRHL
jgi:2-oxoisovalerate dehydrogenase E2 component (dihydrolipoyl transacylase)